MKNNISKKIYCISCNAKVEAVKTNGKEIYPHRKDLYTKIFYKCPFCLNYVGCHPGTEKPLGCIPTKELKQARIKTNAQEIKSIKLKRKEQECERLKNKLNPKLKNAHCTYFEGQT